MNDVKLGFQLMKYAHMSKHWLVIAIVMFVLFFRQGGNGLYIMAAIYEGLLCILLHYHREVSTSELIGSSFLQRRLVRSVLIKWMLIIEVMVVVVFGVLGMLVPSLVTKCYTTIVLLELMTAIVYFMYSVMAHGANGFWFVLVMVNIDKLYKAAFGVSKTVTMNQSVIRLVITVLMFNLLTALALYKRKNFDYNNL